MHTRWGSFCQAGRGPPSRLDWVALLPEGERRASPAQRAPRGRRGGLSQRVVLAGRSAFVLLVALIIHASILPCSRAAKTCRIYWPGKYSFLCLMPMLTS